jgi:ankyrin repeat protein
VLLWLLPIGFCLLPGAACLAALASFDLGLGDIEQTDPDCVHDDNELLGASRRGDLAEVTALVEAGEDLDQLDSNGNGPAYCAAFNGHADVVELLLASGVEVDHANVSGETALHWASRHSDLPVVAALVDAGADVNVTTDRGHTPVLWATLEGEGQVVDLLLEAGADPNLRGDTNFFEVFAYLPTPTDPVGSTSRPLDATIPTCASLAEPEPVVTPLDVAVATDSAEIAGSLLVAGADPDSAVYECTPLHVASWFCNPGMVALLLFAGATGSVENPSTPTPMEVAESQGCVGAADLLRSAQSGEPGG